MSFTKTMYDPQAALLTHKRNVGINKYLLFDGNAENQNECSSNTLSSVSQLKKDKNSDMSQRLYNRVDAESKLQGRNIPLNKSNLQNSSWGELDSTMRNNEKCDFTTYLDFPHSCGINQNSLISHPKTLFKGLSTLPQHMIPFLTTNRQDQLTSTMNETNSWGKSIIDSIRPTNVKQLIKDHYDGLSYANPPVPELPDQKGVRAKN